MSRLPAPGDFEHDDNCAGKCCHPEWWPDPTPDTDLPEGPDL